MLFRSRQIKFHPLATIIKGPNDTGKSSMIKSIWETFGAVAPNVHPRWRYANVSSLVTFQVDDERFAIFRSGSSYSLFNSHNSLIGTYHSVTNDLGPQLASIFNFQFHIKASLFNNLKLTSSIFSTGFLGLKSN